MLLLNIRNMDVNRSMSKVLQSLKVNMSALNLTKLASFWSTAEFIIFSQVLLGNLMSKIMRTKNSIKIRFIRALRICFLTVKKRGSLVIIITYSGSTEAALL